MKVLDLTHYIAGPYCTKLMADLGADVIKVEKPGEGDPARRMGPFPGDEPDHEKSALFLHLNTNKKGVTLNLRCSTGQRIFRELVKDADILVESFEPGTMARWALDFESLEKMNSGLVMASISNFGQYGPYRDFKLSDGVLYAMGGDMYTDGMYQREPVKFAPNVVLYEAGSSAAVGIMGAYYGAKHGGTGGQYVDVSLMETMASSVDRRVTNLIAYQYCGQQMIRISQAELSFPSGAYPCKDGYFGLIGTGMRWTGVARMIGDPELEQPPWSTLEAQFDPKRRDEFYERWWFPYLNSKTQLECWEDGQAAALFCSPLNTPADIMRDQHLGERKFFVKIEHPVAGKTNYPGAPYILSETPWQVKRAAPLLGQHNNEVYLELGYTKRDLVILRQQGVI
ncbi:MAG: CoA transferase [Dehalococcoidia bacterium]|nr:MAG: CoA transferase [Dehalococcoidia bacterium]